MWMKKIHIVLKDDIDPAQFEILMKACPQVIKKDEKGQYLF